MEIGLHIPQWGAPATRESLLMVGRAAEDAGLASLWVSDHVVYPLESKSHYPFTEDGDFPLYDSPFLEMFAVLGLLAGSTSRIALGTSVMVLPMRNVILTAKQLSTLGAVAPGRLIVGVGAGWLREEFELLGGTYDGRGRMLEEQIEALRGLLGQPRFSYEGDFLRFSNLVMEPLPDEVPPIWIGGNSRNAMARAGRIGDAWHPVSLGSVDDLREGHARVRAVAAAAGRDEDVPMTVRIVAKAVPSHVEEMRAEFNDLRDAGCSHVVVDPEYASLDDALLFCERLGELAAELQA